MGLFGARRWQDALEPTGTTGLGHNVVGTTSTLGIFDPLEEGIIVGALKDGLCIFSRSVHLAGSPKVLTVPVELPSHHAVGVDLLPRTPPRRLHVRATADKLGELGALGLGNLNPKSIVADFGNRSTKNNSVVWDASPGHKDLDLLRLANGEALGNHAFNKYRRATFPLVGKVFKAVVLVVDAVDAALLVVLLVKLALAPVRCSLWRVAVHRPNAKCHARGEQGWNRKTSKSLYAKKNHESREKHAKDHEACGGIDEPGLSGRPWAVVAIDRKLDDLLLLTNKVARDKADDGNGDQDG